MGNMSGCHCMSHAMPQNIQQHTVVMVTITYDRPSSVCLPRLNSMLEMRQPSRPITMNSTVPTQKGAEELAYAMDGMDERKRAANVRSSERMQQEDS